MMSLYGLEPRSSDAADEVDKLLSAKGHTMINLLVFVVPQGFLSFPFLSSLLLFSPALPSPPPPHLFQVIP